MKLKLITPTLVILIFVLKHTYAQEGLPIYADYLTDNYYLIHPSMAGAANCTKVRITGRQQWFGHEDAPQLLTLSASTRIGDSPSALGINLYTDKNGYHSQTGGYITYAHHIMFSRTDVYLNMLSFGLSVGAIQYNLDETEFKEFDPIIAGINQSATQLNLDFGFSYHLNNFYLHGTVKNMLKNEGINNNIEITSNLRRYLASAGNVFRSASSSWSYEPSIMFQYREGTEEASIDINGKIYKSMPFGKLWGGISYRRSLDGAEYIGDSGISAQKSQYITPFLGANINSFMVAYTYTHQSNAVVFTNGGFHQITLGINLNCKERRYKCDCPAVN